MAERLGRPYADFAAGVRKQATVPVGALVAGLAGTAPALAVRVDGGAAAIALPGPPRELQELWPRVLELEPVRAVLARARPPLRGGTLRFFGVSESTVARAFAEAGGDGDGVEVTICAREFEIHVDLVVEPGAEARAEAFEVAFVPSIERFLYARDEQPIEAVVLEACRARGASRSRPRSRARAGWSRSG